MKRNSKLMKLARKFLPIMHGRYREMCSLAATGQLGGPDMSELNEHIAACDSCREFLESVTQVSIQIMPVRAEGFLSPARVAPPQGMRGRFLSRLAVEAWSAGDGVTRRQVPMVVQKAAFESLPSQREEKAHSRGSGPEGRLAWLSPLRRSAAILAVCSTIGIVGFYGGLRTAMPKARRVTQLHPPGLPDVHEDLADVSDRMSLFEQQRKDLASQLRETNEQLNASETQEKMLRQRLADASNKLAALTAQTDGERQRLTQADQQASANVTYLQGELEKLRWQLDDAKTKFAAQQNESERLRAKLEETESSLQRELDLKSAKTEMGDLAAARNLHIVDVYDADPNGKRQRSFGRVFYNEGESLVFYAYDLEDPGRFKANVVFHVWGGKAGVKESTHSLGILRQDDAGQGRWAMTFDDPKVLAQINSVFVTAESASKLYDQPHGKKVLYAYFGNPPNHP
jgi:predicted  nucleic acid-binding Zn-ribbon protein